MKSFENFRPRLKAGQVIPQGDKVVFETSSPFDQIVLPIENLDLLLLCDGKRSLREIIEELYRRQGSVHFRATYKAVMLLRERGFLQNGHQLKPVEQERPDSWNFNFKLKPIWQVFLGKRIFNDRISPGLFYLVSMATIVLAILALGEISFDSLSLKLLHVDDSFVRSLVLFVVSGSILMSLKNFLKLFLLLFLTGRAYNFSLAFNGAFFYFRTGSESLFLISNKLYVTIFHLSVALSYFVFSAVFYWLFPDAPYKEVLFMISAVLAIVDLDPFRPSELSQFFRALYEDENLVRLTAYLKTRSFLSLISPSERQSDTGLYFMYSHVAIVWSVISFYLLGGSLAKEARGLFDTIAKADMDEQLAAMGILFVLVSCFAMVFVNLGQVVMANIVMPAQRRLRSYARKRKVRTVNDFQYNEVMTILEHLPLFTAFNNEFLSMIVSKSEIIKYPVGTPVVIQGNMGRSLYVLLDGILDVEKRIDGGQVNHLGELHPSAIFGEVAVIEEKPRTADVVAQTDAIVLVIPAHVIRQMARDSQYVREIDDFQNLIMVNQFFSSAPEFRDLPTEVVQLFVARGKIEIYGPQQTIIRQGARGDSFYMTLRGAVDVLINDHPVARIKQGGFFGEIALIADVPRTATITARERTVVLKIGADAFWETLSQDIRMALFIESVGQMRIQEDIDFYHQPVAALPPSVA